MAQKLKFGNGTWATKKGSTLAYNDDNNNYKPLPFTTTRNSIATRVNKEGLIEVVGSDIPRIDYTDSTEGVLLLENSATNLLTYSEDFTQWTNDRVTVLENQIISPNGLQNADLISENSENNIHRIYIGSISLTDDVDYTITVFAKKGSSSVIQLTPTSTSAIGSGRANFDLENGVVSIVSGGTANIENYGNGWYRCTYTFEALATATSAISVNMVNDDLNAARNVTYTGSTNNNIYLWGGQLEVGSYATSYIPTSGSSVTRAADTSSGAGNDVVFNDSEGVLFAELSLINDSGVSNNITLGDGTSSTNRMMLIFSNGTTNRISARFDSSASDVTLNADGYNLTLNHKVVLKYKANDIAIWVDGFEIDSGNSFSAPSLLNRLDFYNPFSGGQNNFYGKTKEISYYDTALTDEELEYMTSYRTLRRMAKELNLNKL